MDHTVPWDVSPHCWEDLIDEETRLVYEAYARPLRIGRAPAVVAIDLYALAFQGGPVAPAELQETYPSSCGRFAHQAAPAVLKMLEAARSAGLPLVHVTASSAPTLMTPTSRHRTTLPGRSPYEFYPLFAPKQGELVVEKERASAFYGTQLVAELVRQQVDTVIVVGQTTSGCIRASVVDAYSNGFHVVVVEEAVFDRSWLNHCISLFDMHHKYADVLPFDLVQRMLTGATT